VLVIPAYAKLNLALDVTARRADGWHDIDTLIVPIDWHDLVGVEMVIGHDGPPAVNVTGSTSRADDSAVDTLGSDSNLAVRAAALVADAMPERRINFRLWLDKRIPIAAGLGGGSADAAATLRAAARLVAHHGGDAGRVDMIAAARALGSDVPALLATGAVRATGRGENITAVAFNTLWFAVVFVAPSLTRDVYAAMLAEERIDTGRVQRLIATLAAASPLDTALLGSALEPAACRVNPALASATARLRSRLPDVAWHMTGSGGALFSVARDLDHATELAGAARAIGFTARACRSVGSSP